MGWQTQRWGTGEKPREEEERSTSIYANAAVAVAVPCCLSWASMLLSPSLLALLPL
jgi:hypothetical protein